MEPWHCHEKALAWNNYCLASVLLCERSETAMHHSPPDLLHNDAQHQTKQLGVCNCSQLKCQTSNQLGLPKLDGGGAAHREETEGSLCITRASNFAQPAETCTFIKSNWSQAPRSGAARKTWLPISGQTNA
ncbi:unnamed protein product [Symbiodinium sp. CCMP2456]|nr:unnamed protein product [Symbiodinium sp. CCMP2456]